ncbi:hypothetical protein [Nostoc sp. WHI]|uniref:hypothetical protein n=1 Tax=Nostoc sp. WHI TaxID=2650611 RepID=UPI001E3CFE47|nr:hypothetical protein [Nostoc sp. WHI]
MKSLGSGSILKSKSVAATQCLHCAMNLPVSVVVNGFENMKDLEQALAAAKTFESMDDNDVQKLLSLTQGAAADGKFELCKTTTTFDGTVQHPEWLVSEARFIRKRKALAETNAFQI